jgi:FHA domain
LARFRLRFLLQEIDLPVGDTLIGRSGNCQVTLDDPLVSREHAKIHIQENLATVEDLGSRNGVQVQGQVIRGKTPLANGDRIRIGTQELVFLEVSPSLERPTQTSTRQTGFMCHCASCARAYPEELVACPACGSRDRIEEDTLTGSGQKDWGLALAAEAVARARGAHVQSLERVLAHARTGVEQRLAEGKGVERQLLDGIALAAAEVAVARGEASWGRWALSIHASLGATPSAALSDTLLRLPREVLAQLAPAAARALDSCGAAPADPLGVAALRKLTEGAGR